MVGNTRSADALLRPVTFWLHLGDMLLYMLRHHCVVVGLAQWLRPWRRVVISVRYPAGSGIIPNLSGVIGCWPAIQQALGLDQDQLFVQFAPLSFRMRSGWITSIQLVTAVSSSSMETTIATPRVAGLGSGEIRSICRHFIRVAGRRGIPSNGAFHHA